MADNQVDLKLNLDFKGVNDALYQMIGEFNGTDKEFQKIADNIQKNAKKLEASILVFGPASKQAAAAQKALQANMISLVANGVNPEIAAIGTLSQNFNSLNGIIEKTQVATNKTTATLDTHASSLKQNNQKYTAFALILQDLPYGFRAIQNNLPALIGSFAGVGGIAYLAFSAIVAGFTFYDEALRKSAASAKKLKEEQASLNDEILDSKQNALQQGYLLNQYIEIAKNATLSDKTRNEALRQANKLYGEHNEKLTLANINTKAVKESVDGYIQSLIQMAVAQKYSDQVANNIIKSDKIQAQIDKKKEQSYALLLEYTGKQTMESRDVVDVMYDRRVVEIEIAKLEQQKITNGKELITLTDKYSQSLVKATELSAKFGKVEAVKAGKDKKEPKDTYSKDFLDALQLEQKLFVDNLDNQLSYAEGNDQKKVMLLQKSMSDLVSWYNQGIIEETFYQNTIADLFKKTFILKEDLLKKERDAKEKADKELTDRSIYFTEQRIKAVQIEADASIKANRGNYQAQKQALEEAIVKLAVLRMAGIGGAEAMLKLNEALSNTKAKLDGLVDPLESFNTSLNDIIRKTLENMAVAIGESLGKMLSGGGGGIKELMNNFLSIMAEGLIQIGKLAIQTGIAILGIKEALKTLNPYVAIAAGIALVALGTYVKGRLSSSADAMGGTKKFANGGIISGPTMGLMGEYPGASHNPEVVAPLDKLKSLIGGGGGGTLEARISGNDLLILMNKAGRNNNNTF
jgi:hypothetical protein